MENKAKKNQKIILFNKINDFLSKENYINKIKIQSKDLKNNYSNYKVSRACNSCNRKK